MKLLNDILNPNGLLSTSKDDYMQVWTDYFQTLFNPLDTGLRLRQLGQLSNTHTTS